MIRIKRIILALLLALAILIPGSVLAADSDSTQLGSVTITKYEDTEEQKVIPGCTFEIYQLAIFENSDHGYMVDEAFASFFGDTTWVEANSFDFSSLQDKVSDLYAAAQKAGLKPVQSGVTDSDGVVKFTELPEGYYFVVETAAPDYVTEKSANFLVSIPMTNATGTGFVYNIEVFPKNVVQYPEPVPTPEPTPSTPVYTGLTGSAMTAVLIGAALIAGAVLIVVKKRKTAKS